MSVDEALVRDHSNHRKLLISTFNGTVYYAVEGCSNFNIHSSVLYTVMCIVL